MTRHIDEKKVIICKHCGRLEYEGQMKWNADKCSCRSCYKEDYEKLHFRPYPFNDLDGPTPTYDEY